MNTDQAADYLMIDIKRRFFELYQEGIDYDPFLHLEIEHYRTIDWCVSVGTKNMGWGVGIYDSKTIVSAQAGNLHKALIKAYIQLERHVRVMRFYYDMPTEEASDERHQGGIGCLKK